MDRPKPNPPSTIPTDRILKTLKADFFMQVIYPIMGFILFILVVVYFLAWFLPETSGNKVEFIDGPNGERCALYSGEITCDFGGR